MYITSDEYWLNCIYVMESSIGYRREYNAKMIGKNLRRLREAKNLTVEDVRKYLRMGSIQAIYKYEEGKSLPTADSMFSLMELYDATLYDIIDNPG